MLRLKDVNILGCAHTLFPIAEKYAVDKDVIYEILDAIYEQEGVSKVTSSDKSFPKDLTSLNDRLTKAAVEQKLLEKNKNGYRLSNLAIQIFEETANKQKSIQNDAFYAYPRRFHR